MTTGRALELVIDELRSTGPHGREMERAIKHLEVRHARIEERRMRQFLRRQENARRRRNPGDA